jgi:hypothetical protein
LTDHVHPLRGTLIVLAFLDLLVGPVVLTADLFGAYFLAGTFLGTAHTALLWTATRRGDEFTAAVLARIAGGAAVGAVVAVAGACLYPAIGVGGAALVLAAVLSAPYLYRRVTRRGATPAAATSGPTLDLLTPPLHGYSTAQLSAAWSTSQEALRRSTSAADRSAIAALRQAYLDELERRDSSGLQRWLESGNALTSDPSRFLRAGGQGEPDPDPR